MRFLFITAVIILFMCFVSGLRVNRATTRNRIIKLHASVQQEGPNIIAKILQNIFTVGAAIFLCTLGTFQFVATKSQEESFSQLKIEIQSIQEAIRSQEKKLDGLQVRLDGFGYAGVITVALIAGSGNLVQVLEYVDDRNKEREGKRKKEKRMNLKKKERKTIKENMTNDANI